jgi:uncharacterized protein YkwD
MNARHTHPEKGRSVGGGTIISKMSRYLWTWRCVGPVVLTVWLLAGSITARDSTDPSNVGLLRSQTTRNQPAAEFDPTAACDEVVRAHNRLRAEAKLPPLAISTKLTAAAERHAKDMAAHEKMNHKGSDSSSPIDRIKAEGYPYRRAGENIAAGRYNIERLMKVWVDSPHHKKNILGSFSQIGVACATGESGKRYWCVTFGLPIRR